MSVLPLDCSSRATIALPCAFVNGPRASANLRCLWPAFASTAEMELRESATALHPHRYIAASTSSINLGRRADPAQVLVGWSVKVASAQAQTMPLYLDLSDFAAPSHEKLTPRPRLRASGRATRTRNFSAARENYARSDQIGLCIRPPISLAEPGSRYGISNTLPTACLLSI
jgi:hypothetical protein